MDESIYKIASVKNLANLLHVETETLLELAKSRYKYYRRKPEEKPSGGIRILYIPNGELKRVQELIQKKILRDLPSHQIIHGYTRKRSPITIAKLHLGKPYIVRLDIKGFYPSVRPWRVCQVFRQMGTSEDVARLLTQLVTYRNQLPQGPPTSPDIAKQVLDSFCKRVERLCQIHGLTPGVYGDDLYVSGTIRVKRIKNLLMRIIIQEGFLINENKIEVMKPGQRKIVTGVIVNEKLNIPKEYYRELRKDLFVCKTKGPGALFEDDFKKGKDHLRGKIEHVKRLNPRLGANLEQQFNLIKWDGPI